MTNLPLITRAHLYGDRVAIRCEQGERRYRDLLQRSATIAEVLLGEADDLGEARVACLVPACDD